MDKLGFTFYPKDWWTSDTFFNLPPELRYIYLEIIFILYTNDGSWRADRTLILKRFGIDVGDKGFQLLSEHFYINDDGDWSHPSVNKRLNKALISRENGKKGGRPQKPRKPSLETQNNPASEREGEREGERESKRETENETPSFLLKQDGIWWEQQVIMKYRGADHELVLIQWEAWYMNKFEWRKKDLFEMKASLLSWFREPKKGNNFNNSVDDIRL